MQTISIGPLPGATPADPHGARDTAEDGTAEGLAFGQELALMMLPDAAQLPAPEVVASDTGAAAPDTAQLVLDSTQIVDSLIAPGNVLPSASVPAEGSAIPDLIPAAAVLAAGTAVPAAPTVPAVPAAAAIPVTLPMPAAVAAPLQAPVLPRDAAAAALAMPLTVHAQGARVLDSRTAPARGHSTDTAAESPSLTDSAEPRELGDVREAFAPREPDTRGLRRASPVAADTPAAPLLAASVAERASLEPALPRADTAASLDALSATALMSRWTPAASAADPTAAPATARVETPFGTEGWKDAFQQKIVWLVDRQQQSAELHLNPPNLGPVEVVLNMSEDAVSIAFVSPHLAVREAIETSLAELRATLQERGLAMGNALVSADQSGAREQFQQEAAAAARAARPSGIELPGDLPGDIPRPRATLLGLVDTFA